MGRDSHCNLPPNKTHSYSSQLKVDPNTFAIQHKCSKNSVSASIQGRYFSVFRDIPNSLRNEKMIIQKSLHPQFGDCMAKQQLIKSHNIAKYSKMVILSCDKRRFYPWIVLDMDLRCGRLLYWPFSFIQKILHYD